MDLKDMRELSELSGRASIVQAAMRFMDESQEDNSHLGLLTSKSSPG